MRIERTTDISEVLKCMPFEQVVINKGRDKSRIRDRLLFVKSQIENPYFGFWMAYDDNNEIIGYAIASLVLMPGMERLVLLRMYAPTKEIREELSNVLRDWAKQYKVKLAQISVTKGVKALERKYGFKPDSINMIRRI